LGLTPWLSAATPLGWTWLLRLVPGGGQQRFRLLTLAFTVLAVLAGYYFGRALPLMRFVGGLFTGAAVLLVPAMLVRDDLKQYTAEAFASVLLLALVARVENSWSRSQLAAIAGCTAGGLLFANSVIFVGVAAMAALAIETVLRRDRHRLFDVAVASAAMLAVGGAIYELIDRRHVIPGLTSFWDAYYVPRHQGLSAALSFLHLRASQLAPDLGFRSLAIDLVLALAGIAALIWLKRYALALMVPITVGLVVVASAARRYPFGDLRTSTFWLVMVAVLMAVGVATGVQLVAKLNRPVAMLFGAAALAVWVSAANPSIRSHPIPAEDVRSQVAYLNAHRRPGDIVILSYSASFGFAYYDRSLTPSFRHITYATTGFLPIFPGVPWLVQMTNRQPADVAGALTAASADIAREPPGTAGRIWIVRSHLIPEETDAWQHDLAGKDVTEIPVGVEPILLYQPA
jgi:hypothetical protein